MGEINSADAAIKAVDWLDWLNQLVGFQLLAGVMIDPC
jgi:hypothetical protein